MIEQKQLKTVAVSLLIIISSILLSEWLLKIVAASNDFEVGDLGGYFYVKFVVPLISGVLAFTLFCIRREIVFSWKSVIRIFWIFLVVAVVSFFMHTAAINSRNIGWYKIPEHFDVAGESLTELSNLLFHRNNEVRSVALKELERRGPSTADTLVKIIEDNRKRDPYHETYEMRKVVEILAKQKDVRVISTLNEMLKSERYTSIITHKDGTRTAQYSTRIEAKNLLKKYFNIEVQVETGKILSSKNSK